MNSSILWKKFRRILAFALVAALFGNTVPQTLLEVRAAESVSIADAEVSFAADSVVQNGIATYTGSAIEPAVVVTYNGTTLTEGTDYTVSYTDNTEVSTDGNSAQVVVQGTANEESEEGYYGQRTLQFEIVEASDNNSETIELTEETVTLTFVDGIGTVEEDGNKYSVYAYTGESVEILSDVTYNGTELEKDKDYTVSYDGNGEASSGADATVTITGSDKYSGTITKKFGIRKQLSKDNTEITVDDTGIVYDGTDKTPSVTVKFGDAELTEGTDYTLSYSGNKDAGTATVTVSGVGSYYGSADTTFTIQQKDISNESFSIVSKEYTGNTISVDDLKVMLGEEEFTSCTISYDGEIKDVSVYYVTITGTGNYTGSKTIEFKVTKSSNISAECVSVEGAFKCTDTENSNKYYYKTYGDVTITGQIIETDDEEDSITYTIKGCDTEGCSYDEGEKRLPYHRTVEL